MSFPKIEFKKLVIRGPQNGIYKSADLVKPIGSHAMIDMGDAFIESEINCDKPATIDLSSSEADRFTVYKGDLLFARRSLKPEGSGACSYVSELARPHTFESSLIRVTLDPKRCDPLFYFQFWNSRLGKQIRWVITRQVAVSGITGEDLGNCLVPFPSLDEQRKIAKITSHWDHAFAILEKMIQVQGQFRYALMQQLFTGKHRLLKHHEQKWHKVSLSEATAECAKRNTIGLGTEAVRAVNKSEGMIPMKESTIGSSLDRYKVVAYKEFAYNPMRLNIGSICRWEGQEPALVSPDYVVFRCRPDRLDPDFLNHFRHTHRWKSFVNSIGAGGVRVRIYYDQLAEMTINLPSIEEQKMIASVLNTCDDELRLLRTQLAALRRQKQGLMQQLLTGKIQVAIND